MKKLIKILAAILAAAILIVGAYLAYAFISYYRLEDYLEIVPEAGNNGELQCGTEYSAITWNLGFGAYSADYSFFMDGGQESRGRSAEEVSGNILSAANLLCDYAPDICLLEEVDLDSTRSYHIDEKELIVNALSGYSVITAQNYDSPYLFYPITEPHGASRSSMLTLSNSTIDSCIRRSLPVESGFRKFLDLDRCYSVTRIPVDAKSTLCVYTVHLSAYTADGALSDEQLSMLMEDMQAEYRNGNYVLCGGDFNKDLLGNSAEVFGFDAENLQWALPINKELIPDEFQIVAPFDADNPVASCRNATTAYKAGESMVLTVDGFIVSDNIEVCSSAVIDTGFAWSDHNPVVMHFILR